MKNILDNYMYNIRNENKYIAIRSWKHKWGCASFGGKLNFFKCDNKHGKIL